MAYRELQPAVVIEAGELFVRHLAFQLTSITNGTELRVPIDEDPKSWINIRCHPDRVEIAEIHGPFFSDFRVGKYSVQARSKGIKVAETKPAEGSVSFGYEEWKQAWTQKKGDSLRFVRRNVA